MLIIEATYMQMSKEKKYSHDATTGIAADTNWTKAGMPSQNVDRETVPHYIQSDGDIRYSAFYTVLNITLMPVYNADKSAWMMLFNSCQFD